MFIPENLMYACLVAQGNFGQILNKFRIKYSD